ncbi:hypothetical protein [Tumebacillus algifaecis]|nr:hypothetical protein [Tumebacillus algifaecis]
MLRQNLDLNIRFAHALNEAMLFLPPHAKLKVADAMAKKKV